MSGEKVPDGFRPLKVVRFVKREVLRGAACRAQDFSVFVLEIKKISSMIPVRNLQKISGKPMRKRPGYFKYDPEENRRPFPAYK